MAITFTNHVDELLKSFIDDMQPSNVLVLADDNTARQVLPRLPSLATATAIVIPAGDCHKTIDTTCQVWQQMEAAGATRHSIMVCLGGGVVTDLGGFAASTFKRGIPFINVPTTLLAAVDAAAGGKTGINYSGLKNEIGLFSHARQVYLQLVKKAKKKGKMVRDTISVMLNCLRKDIGILMDILAKNKMYYECLFMYEKRTLTAIFKMYHQQEKMFWTKTHTCADRILSIFQP